MNGLNLNMSPQQIGRMMRNPSNIADLLTDEHPQTGDSPAEIFADIINVQRMDIKRLAQVHDVDVSISRMTPERAAELLAGTIGGDGIELVVMFNELAEKRDKVLCETLDDGDYSDFMARKHTMMNTEPDGGDDGAEA